jgi:hypothetical protein
MKIISNRAAIIVRAKAPFVEWVQSADADSSHITTEEVNEDPNVYLIYDPKKEGEIDRLIAKNYREIFEEELNSWFTDESLWPKKRDLKTFRQWFQVDFHDMVVDLSEEDFYTEE